MRLSILIALCCAAGCSGDKDSLRDAAVEVGAADAADDGTDDAPLPSMFDARYCEVFLVKLQGANATVEVYNTVGLNLCPASSWDALDTAKLKQEHSVFAVMLNGPRYWTTDGAKAGSSVGSTVVTFGGIDMKKLAEIKITLSEMKNLKTG